MLANVHCKNEYALSNQYNCGNRLQAILLIKFNKLELSNNESNYSLKVNHLKSKVYTKIFNKNISLTDRRQRLTLMCCCGFFQPLRGIF